MFDQPLLVVAEEKRLKNDMTLFAEKAKKKVGGRPLLIPLEVQELMIAEWERGKREGKCITKRELKIFTINAVKDYNRMNGLEIISCTVFFTKPPLD